MIPFRFPHRTGLSQQCAAPLWVQAGAGEPAPTNLAAQEQVLSLSCQVQRTYVQKQCDVQKAFARWFRPTIGG